MRASPVPVLLVAQQLTQGGSERQLTETAKALDRSLFTPHVGVMRAGGLRIPELEAAGVPVACFPVSSFASPGALAAAWHFGAYMRRHGIRLVHAFDAPANVFAVPAARFWRTPVVVSSQRAYRRLTPGRLYPLLRLTDKMVDAIVVNCQVLQRHLEDDEGVRPELIRLCYNGIDTSHFRRRPKAFPDVLRGASIVVGVVCALRPEKGLPTLVRAFAQAQASCPGMRLLIVGDGQVRAQLESLSVALGVRAVTVFVPSSATVTDWLREIDIFVLPSLCEALSNSLMEAMACGCAVAASRTGGNPELVADGERGVLFEPGNDGELAFHLVALASSPELRQRYAAAGEQFIHQRFGVEVAAARMAEIYSELLGRKGFG